MARTLTPFFPSAPNILPLMPGRRSEEHTSELQSQSNLVCRLLLEKKNMQATPGTDAAALGKSLRGEISGLNVTSTADVRNQNQDIAKALDRLIIVMVLPTLAIAMM